MSEEKFIKMGNEEYHAHDALGSSDLRKLIRSPLHLKGHEEPATRPPHFVFGSAVHAGYLEPEEFAKDYKPKPLEIDGKGPRTSYCKDWLANQPLGTNWMSLEDYDKALDCVNSALEHPITKEMFTNEVVTEGSLFFTLHGVKCKIRPDLVSIGEDGVDVLDLKTTQDASPTAFRTTVGKLGYHVQEWFYREGLRAAGLKVNRFVFLAVEKSAPFATAAYVLNQEDVEGVAEVAEKALLTYKDCEMRDLWPGYTKEVLELSLPPWKSPRKEGPNGSWLSVKQVMDHYRMSRSSVYNWMGRGIKHRKFGGKRLISARSLEKVLGHE